MTSLYILDINLLSVIWFAHIFSNSIGCLFISSLSFFFFFFFPFLGFSCGILKFLGLNPSCSCQPMLQTQQCGIQAASVTYTTACGNTGSLTPWMRPGSKPISIWIPVGFLICWATTGIPCLFIFLMVSFAVQNLFSLK